MYNKFSDDENICLQQPVADLQIDIFSKKVKWEELASLPVCHAAHTAVLLGEMFMLEEALREEIIMIVILALD